MIIPYSDVFRRRKTKVRSGASQHHHHPDDVICYDKMHAASPREEHLPMIVKQQTYAPILRDYDDTMTCQVHGTYATTKDCVYGILPRNSAAAAETIVECPYATLPRYCQCTGCAADSTRTTLSKRCINPRELSSAQTDAARAQASTSTIYERGGETSKGVRFATINDKTNKPKTTLNTDGIGRNLHTVMLSKVLENSPDILPAPMENESNEIREQQISSFKSL